MSDEINQAMTTKAATQEMLEPQIDHKGSVKADDFSSGNAVFMFPAYGYGASTLGKTAVLPKTLPAFNRYGFYTSRDITLLRTPYHEAMWATAVATAVTKAAAWGWEVAGNIPLRRKRLHELMQYATASVFMGWVPFVSAHLRSFLHCGYGVVEIVREQNRYSSKITGLNHLNPLRCRFTDNPRYPVEYLDRQGRIHRLAYWQVIMMTDQVDPTEGDLAQTESAAFRAYDRIKTMEATHMYLYEKVTGGRPTAVEFIQGITFQKLQDSITSANHQKDMKGTIMYKGAIMVPIQGDIPIQRVSVPIAELPDGFNYQEIHDNTAIIYAGATGLDPNDIDPRIAQRTALGSGAQALVLNQKAAGKGFAAWRVDWVDQIHRLVADTATTFAWSEDSMDDELKKAQVQNARADVRKKMQDNGEIDQAQSKNLAADAGDIPKDFLTEEDKTPMGVSESEDNPQAQKELKLDDVDLLVKSQAAIAKQIAAPYQESQETAVDEDAERAQEMALIGV